MTFCIAILATDLNMYHQIVWDGSKLTYITISDSVECKELQTYLLSISVLKHPKIKALLTANHIPMSTSLTDVSDEWRSVLSKLYSPQFYSFDDCCRDCCCL